MNANREMWSWIWPRFALVFPIELLLSVAIIGVAITLAVVSYTPVLFKAKLSEALFASGNARADLVEQLALSGDLVETPLVESGTVVSVVTAEDYLSGRRTVQRRRADPADRVEAKAEHKRVDLTYQDRAKKAIEDRRLAREAGGGGTSKYVSSIRIVGNTIVIAGKIDGIGGRDYELALYPAVADEELPSVYIWLCGRHRIPEGWLAQSPVLTSDLPSHLLVSECKRRKLR